MCPACVVYLPCLYPVFVLHASCICPACVLQVASQWVEVPLGSVRASLGYMSTWEDCYALVQFIESNYRDRSQ